MIYQARWTCEVCGHSDVSKYGHEHGETAASMAAYWAVRDGHYHQKDGCGTVGVRVTQPEKVDEQEEE